MGKFFVFFLFWTSCLIQVETVTKFRIGGQLICDYNKDFRYSIYLYDRDLIIGRTRNEHVRGSVNFSMLGRDINRGESNYYHPYMKISHSCNLNNRGQRCKYPMGVFYSSQSEVISMNYVINITNAGISGGVLGAPPLYESSANQLTFPS
ncbi:hypothetical protein B9Z55_023098 [Caenorhabditis nigoni]|uniref:Intein C-terminal splicing domain-containing protein n=1 Tax=Caenorhabditis nigoni TaxID=1611254 RepID=A0A2G5SN67_9PELO|nr:hypothetical protein B9Z55_023098 [Caenorhabditis nigoni]